MRLLGVWGPYLMINLVLADAELELVPQEIQGHPAVVKHARIRKKKPSNLILDSTYHHQAIRSKYGAEAERRGRPDIVHFFLMNAQESIANLSGKLRVYVHTRNNEVIYVAPDARLPKSYPRFIGLMENLFHNRSVPNESAPLLKIEKKSLSSLVSELGAPAMLLSESGRRVNINELLMPEDITVIIGGFSRGDFLTNMNFVNEIVAISDRTLMAWVAAFEMIARYETLHIFKR